jgi:hypothetical protein
MNCDHNSETCSRCVIEKAIGRQTKELIEALTAMNQGNEVARKIAAMANPYIKEVGAWKYGEPLVPEEKRGLFWRFIRYFAGVS